MRAFQVAGQLGLLLASVHAARAFACSCLEGPSDPIAERDAHAMVFYGLVVEVRPPVGGRGCADATLDESQVHVDLDVIEAFKGVQVGERVTIATNASDGMCGVDFVGGQSWLLYTDGMYDICSPGGSMPADAPELAALRNGPGDCEPTWGDRCDCAPKCMTDAEEAALGDRCDIDCAADSGGYAPDWTCAVDDDGECVVVP